jgi:peptidoglycan/xylan/chitin deacetylase (PgdA/CDA1 family)
LASRRPRYRDLVHAIGAVDYSGVISQVWDIVGRTVVRTAVALVVVGVALGLPVGGGSEAFVPAAPPDLDAPAPADPPDQRAPAQAPIPRSSFPAFLHALNTERAASRPVSRRSPRQVLLSFDDGPDLAGTPEVLEALDRHKIKAVFFVNGRYLLGVKPADLARRELVRKLATHGHLVANHTLTHRNLCREPATVAEEIDTNSEVIAYATGLRPLLFRSPYGARCRSLDQALRERDLIQVGWSLDPQEWRCEKPDAVFNYVTRRLARLIGPAIILLHDTQPATVRALPRILDWIDEENARLVRDGGSPLQIVDYSVFFPPERKGKVPPTSLEPLLAALGETLSVLPGAGWLATRTR